MKDDTTNSKSAQKSKDNESDDASLSNEELEDVGGIDEKGG